MVNDLPHVIEFAFPNAIPYIDYKAVNHQDGNGDVLDFWNTTKLGAKPSQSALENIEASAPYITFISAPAVLQRFRDSAALAVNSDTAALYKALRAAAAVLVDEINVIRQWEMSFKTEVAAASSLADLKTRVATLPALPDRTLAQAKTAIQAKITAGLVD